MPRTSRAAVGGLVYHVLNRANGRLEIFRKPGDYQAFAELMIDAKKRAQIEIFGFCLMSNHWHLVVRPRQDRDLAGYLCLTVQRGWPRKSTKGSKRSD
jgi:putative transposase